MATKRILPDADFDRIVVRTHRLARNITMRVKLDGLYVTVPPYSLSSKILEVVNQYRQQLLEDWKKVGKKTIDLSFRIHTPCFRLWLEQGAFTCFSVRFTEEGICIVCPRNVDFSLPEVQKLVRNAIIRAMKKSAQIYLPFLLSALSERYHLPFRRVKITGSKGRWGSCSSSGSINLSCYLMLLPPYLMDYVLLHELCHTKEMNHGPRFWELLDGMTEGKARTLRAELRKFHPDL
ncbi:MAG: DUF45 domain-containing protein [Phocaeicola sp.]|nr:DUF45 domain-containing protein [Phocaeicola sp.]